MTANTSPVYPGSIENTVNTFPPTTTTKQTLVTGGTNGTVINSINYHQSAASAMTGTLTTTIGATTVTLGVFTTAATANLALNLLNSAYIKGVNDLDPKYTLAPGQTLELAFTSVSSTVSIVTEAADL